MKDCKACMMSKGGSCEEHESLSDKALLKKKMASGGEVMPPDETMDFEDSEDADEAMEDDDDSLSGMALKRRKMKQ